MLRIGLTGGIASGKSTVAAMFARLGVPVIDTDDVARDVSADGPVIDEIVRAFGRPALDADGTLNRPYLQSKIFDDADTRRRLEAILHPRIRTEVMRRLAGLRASYCLIVVPLLIETDFIQLVDRVLVVDTDEELQIARAIARSRLPRAAVQKILAAQSPRAARLARADDVINNVGGPAELEPQVTRLHRQYLTLADSNTGRAPN